jgi:hypothetical protein
MHGDESGVPYLERCGVDISTFIPLKKKRYVVLLHVCNSIAFRWVLWRRARGKNATVFQYRAMRYISCFEPELADVHDPNDWCGTTHRCHSRSPRLVAVGSRHLL